MRDFPQDDLTPGAVQRAIAADAKDRAERRAKRPTMDDLGPQEYGRRERYYWLRGPWTGGEWEPVCVVGTVLSETESWVTVEMIGGEDSNPIEDCDGEWEPMHEPTP